MELLKPTMDADIAASRHSAGIRLQYSAPKIEQATYLVNYNDSYCITNGDSYPLIPVTP
jgi:hypothetical protein